MATLIGLVLALATMGLSRAVGFDRDRALYPLMLIVIASYYGLFAMMAGSVPTLLAETLGFALFAALACLALTRTRWLAVLGLAGHGLFDAVHPRLIDNPGVPAWWPSFCLSFDVAVALGLAVTLTAARSARALPQQPDPQH